MKKRKEAKLAYLSSISINIEESIVGEMISCTDNYVRKLSEAYDSYLIQKESDNNDLVMPDMQHPVSKVKVNPDKRNTILKERMKRRPKITNTDLPIFQYKSEILKELEVNQSLVIKGDTGCGKTTQVPQFIIDHMTAKGEASNCSMIVTEPRRISAISLAERIARERGERVGDVIGYQVRLESRPPKQNGGMLFCTTGILLRKLQNNPNLEGCSHVIIDEAHERSIDTDMILVLLSRAIRNNSLLKVVIMSATINADLFSNYLNCKSIEVPGRLFPVRMHLLEDMFDQKILFRNRWNNNIFTEIDDFTKVIDKVIKLIGWIEYNKPPGAVLCFLPGWSDIQLVANHLKHRSKLEVIPLHSQVPYENQRKIFQPTQKGKRKVILSTDVAETGITVPDVVYVVDTARYKKFRYNENQCLSSIDTHRISKANLNQRKGRAGRVQEGESYHFVTKKQYEKLDAYPIPEVLTVNLEQTVLDCKTYSKEKAINFLGSMPQPPKSKAVQKAVKDLQILGALDEKENLTALGKQIALFGTHPKLSKALVYSSIFQCSEPVTTIAAALSMDSDIFYNSFNTNEILRTKSGFHNSSDHLCILRIYNKWKTNVALGQEKAFSFCKKYSLNAKNMNNMNKVRNLIAEHLSETNQTDNMIEAFSSQNQFAIPNELILGVLLSGMNQILYDTNKTLHTEDGKQAKLSNYCVNQNQSSQGYSIYYKKTYYNNGLRVKVQESSRISPLTVLLFSPSEITKTTFEFDKKKVSLKVDGINVCILCNTKTAETILLFRQLMKLVVQFHIGDHAKKFIDEKLLYNCKTNMLKVLGDLLCSVVKSVPELPIAVNKQSFKRKVPNKKRSEYKKKVLNKN